MRIILLSSNRIICFFFSSRLLSELVVQHPSLLPPLHPAPPTYPPTMDTAMHAFWLAVCRDALECIASRLPVEMAAEKLGMAQRDSHLRTNAVDPPLFLWPKTPQTLAETSNLLMSVLGIPRDMGAIERMYSRPGGPPTLPPHPQAMCMSATAPVLFRPGDFPWRVAENAVELLTTFASLSTSSGDGPTLSGHISSQPQSQPQQPRDLGPQWALACLPAVHHLVHGTGQAGKMLQKSYISYRSALEGALGPDSTAAYPLVAPSRAPAPASAQEQRQPNTINSGDSAAPRVGVSAVAVPQPIPPRVVAHAPPPVAVQPPQACGVTANPAAGEQRVESNDKSISELGGMEQGTIAPLTGILYEIKWRTVAKTGNLAAHCFLKDYSGPGGSDARAEVVVYDSSLVDALQSLQIGPEGPFPVVDFSAVRVVKSIVEGFACRLVALNDTTVLNRDPQNSIARDLRRRQARSLSPTDQRQLQSAHHRLESQSTQAMFDPPAVVVKAENGKSEADARHGAFLKAVSSIVEMGYLREVARRAVMDVMKERGAEWRKIDELIDAAMRKLL